MDKPALLDFLYSDHERVASILAQLLGVGSPKTSEQSATKSKNTKQQGSINLGVLGVSAGGERDWSQEVRDVYDPLWSNSRKLIDEIEELQLDTVERAVELGQIRILSGKLLAYDQSNVTSLMSSPFMEDFIASGISDDSSAGNRSGAARKAEKKREAGIIREFIKGLPLGIGFVLVTGNEHFWFSVNRDYLSLYELDIPLKFPTHISGIWNVLGVIDAESNDHVNGINTVLDRNIDGLMAPMVLQMMELTGTITALFGRPLARTWPKPADYLSQDIGLTNLPETFFPRLSNT